MKKLCLLTILTAISLSFTACNATSGVFIGLASDKSVYKAAEPMAVALTLLNQQPTTIQFALPNSQVYDLYLYDIQDNLVWKWSGDKMFAMALTNFKLEPGLPVTYVFKLNPTKPSGQPLTPGKYKLVGLITAKEKLLSKPLEIEIRQ